MKRIFSIVVRDFKSSIRDFMIIYIIVAPPILIAYLIAGFVPKTETASVKIGVDATINNEVRETLSEYLAVELFSSRDTLEARVNGIDDYIGLSTTSDGVYEIVKEGNEMDDTTELIRNLLRKDVSEKKWPSKSHCHSRIFQYWC